jgi:hypothetical protein
MIQFELLDVTGISPVKQKSETEMAVICNITVGIVGMPNEDKYKQFKSVHTVEYVWVMGGSDVSALTGMATFAQNWVEENYQTID